ncbi:DUF6188 family protein [Saccharothrix luteola]|uniref:DUF6188 family protein n=1 Tax=Saccharothrix luteola TaxID=2893018 RepID=UPI001E4616F3|nr:DUF6188 family protein [Saccharothrix luteola]MCC8245509.1 DUF6188 family protein [Saccharothrix luteola]
MAPATAGLVRAGDAWRLPLAGLPIVQCRVDHAVTFGFDSPDGSYDLRIEEDFAFVSAEGVEVVLRPQTDPTGLGPVLACTRTSVVEALAFDDGRLAVAFADGSRLVVDGSREYEPWMLSGPAKLVVVSTPGGALALWYEETT